MALLKSSNPALSDKVFQKAAMSYADTESMTIKGTINKTFILLLLIILTASYTWSQFAVGANIMPFIYGGLVGGLVLAFITIFNKKHAYITAPLYALSEGLMLGGISAFLESMFPGIVIQAAALTFGTLFCMLIAYRSGWIKVTEKFKAGVVAATGAVFFVYMLNFILGFFGINLPFIHDTGWMGIGISLVVIVIAALNLILDFDFIEKGAEKGAPKYMEWYSAFGLMVTLVWLYIEFLRLLSKLRD